MSAIGGVVDFKNRGVDFSELNNIRRSMSLRGREGSTAFLCGGVGMVFNSSSVIEDEALRQPYIQQRRGKSFALCIDSDGIEPRSVGEKYLIHGTDFLGCIDGGFAISLYDEERDILILARDRSGKKPLFYSLFEDKIYFASEPKGIIDAIGGVININREAIGYHLVSPMGIYRASSIYADVCELLVGECIIFSGLGISRFFFRKNRDMSRIGARLLERFTKGNIVSAYPSFDASRLGDCLNDTLIAFDYPQFDCFMPLLTELFMKARGQGKQVVIFEDVVKRRNLSYAREREDRLGAICGIRAIGVLTDSRPTVSSEIIDDIEHALSERFFSLPPYERNLLRDIFEQYKLDCLLKVLSLPIKKEDTEQKIRILGMLCQAIEWMQARELRFVGQCSESNSYTV